MSSSSESSSSSVLKSYYIASGFGFLDEIKYVTDETIFNGRYLWHSVPSSLNSLYYDGFQWVIDDSNGNQLYRSGGTEIDDNPWTVETYGVSPAGTMTKFYEESSSSSSMSSESSASSNSSSSYSSSSYSSSSYSSSSSSSDSSYSSNSSSSYSSSSSSNSSSSGLELSNFHHKTNYLNVDNGWIISNIGKALKHTPDLYLSDNINWEFRCVDNSLNPVDVSGYSYVFGIDNSYVHAHTDLILTSSVDDSRANIGILTFEIRMASFNTALETLLGTSSNKSCIACVWAYNPADDKDNHLLAQYTISIKSSVGRIVNALGSSSSSSSSQSSDSSLSSVNSSSSSSMNSSSSNSSSSYSSLSSDSSSSSESSSSSSSSSDSSSSSESSSSSSNACPNIITSLNTTVKVGISALMDKHVNVTMNGVNDQWLPVYIAEVDADPIVDKRILWGETRTTGSYTANGWADIIVNGVGYLTPIYSGDIGINCTSTVYPATPGSVILHGWALVDINKEDLRYIQLYDRI